jgi:glycerol-1-phosphate dehydrogenase [NAD(P)+]
MQLPRYVDIGSGILRGIPEALGSMRIRGKFLVITGSNATQEYGKLVHDLLSSEHDSEIVCVSGQKTEASKVVMEKLSRDPHDYLIAVGGGKTIDIAKYAAFHNQCEFISVPTVVSHDGIASSRVSMANSEGVASIDAIAPIAIMMDTEVIANAPYRFLASGCGDSVSKTTAVKDWELAYRLGKEETSEYACALSLMSAQIVMDSGEVIRNGGEEGVRIVAKALMGSGVAMSIAGSSRPGSGSEHLFYHALESIVPGVALHGEQVGVGTIMMMYLHGGNWREIRAFLSRIGAPVTAGELGIDEESIIKALTSAHLVRPDRYTILGETGLSEAAARRVARRTEVI